MALDGIKRGLSALFGKGSTPKTRAASEDLDLLSPENMPTGALAALWELLDARMPRTPRMIQKARASMNGHVRAGRAVVWDEADDDSLADGADKYVLPRKLAQRLAGKKSVIKRPASGLTPTAQKVSTRCEQWVNGFLDEKFPDYEGTEVTLNEGQSLFLTSVYPIHWETVPTLYDEFGEESEPIGQSDYAALPSHKQREYEPFNPSDTQKPTYKRMRARYRLNSDGEQDDGSASFTVDHKQSAKFFTDEMEDAYARHCPILLRGPISRLDFIPLNPRFSGKTTETDGVLIRTLYRKSKLKREYRWDGCDELLEPVDRYDGRDGDLYLYELWAYDEDQRPYVAYQVGKNACTWADNGDTAVMRLDEEFPGITELPISFEYGDHTGSSDADQRALPFSIPYVSSWAQIDKILSNLGTIIEQFGYPAFGQLITQESVATMAQVGGEVSLEFTYEPGTIKPMFGPLIELTSHGSSPDVKTVLEAHGVLMQQSLPSPGTFGGEGPASGVDRAIIGRDNEIAYAGTIEGMRRHKERCGRHALMVGSALGKKAGRPVALYVTTSSAAPNGASNAQTQTKVELPPDLCGGVWDVIAQFPASPGENLAASSLFLDALEKGAILTREWREWGVGDPHPEQFAAEKLLQDFFTENPAGIQMAMQELVDYLADEKLRQAIELANTGQITTAQGGASVPAMQYLTTGGGQTPQPALPPGPPPPQGGGSMTMGNPAASSLAGNNAGALGASAASQGGPMATPVMGGPG